MSAGLCACSREWHLINDPGCPSFNPKGGRRGLHHLLGLNRTALLPPLDPPASEGPRVSLAPAAGSCPPGPAATSSAGTAVAASTSPPSRSPSPVGPRTAVVGAGPASHQPPGGGVTPAGEGVPVPEAAGWSLPCGRRPVRAASVRAGLRAPGRAGVSPPARPPQSPGARVEAAGSLEHARPVQASAVPARRPREDRGPRLRGGQGRPSDPWFCPTCDDAHVGECPAVTPPRRSFLTWVLDLIGTPA